MEKGGEMRRKLDTARREQITRVSCPSPRGRASVRGRTGCLLWALSHGAGTARLTLGASLGGPAAPVCGCGRDGGTTRGGGEVGRCVVRAVVSRSTGRPKRATWSRCRRASAKAVGVGAMGGNRTACGARERERVREGGVERGRGRWGVRAFSPLRGQGSESSGQGVRRRHHCTRQSTRTRCRGCARGQPKPNARAQQPHQVAGRRRGRH